MNIRWSILVLIAGVVLTAQGLSYWLTRDVLVTTVNERETEKVAAVATIVASLVGEYSHGARIAARALSSSGRLAQALRDPASGVSQETFAAVLDHLISDDDLDILEVTDDHEIVRYRAQDARRSGDRSDAWGVTEALRGKSAMVVHVTPGGTAVLAIEPLRQGDRITGAVIAGKRLDETFIKDLSKDVNAELALVSRNQILASSSAAALGTLDKTAIDEAFHQKISIYRSTPDGFAKVVYVPLLIIDEGFVMMVRVDSRSAFRTLEKTYGVVFKWTVGFLLLSILAAFFLLRAVLKPLRVLRARAEQTAIRATGTAIATRTGDEIGSVVHVLDTLMERLLDQNRELALSRSEALTANDAKSHFLSTMSHEIRTPLNGVLGMAELLHDTELTADQRRYCKAITTSGSALYELLSNILDLSKIEAGKVVIESIDFDLVRLLTDLSSAFGELAATRSNRLIVKIALPPPGCFRGDPTRLRQVLSNLLGNAIKFTEGGNINLTVSALPSRAADPRTWLRFSVRDSGVGISQEALQTLFRPFTQAHSSTTRRYGGTGLGLVISKHLVELLEGSMHVASAPGNGTDFWFEVPLAGAQNTEVAITADAPTRQGLTARVLLAEDNAVNQLVLMAMLAKDGIEVTVVENGELAVQALRQAPGTFDVVLMDCQMPVMDGYEAVRLIRAEEAPGRRIPIVALTANAFAEDRERCLAAGMDDYLTKPVQRDVLAEAVARWAGQSTTPARQIAHAVDAALRPAAASPGKDVEVLDRLVA